MKPTTATATAETAATYTLPCAPTVAEPALPAKSPITRATLAKLLPALLGPPAICLSRLDRVAGACAVKLLRCSLISIRDSLPVLGVVLPIAFPAGR